MEITRESVIAAAIMIPILALIIVGVSQWGFEKYSKEARDAYSPETIFIGAAKVATDLLPLINRLPFHGSEIWIFGADGRYFAKPKGHILIKAIREWMKGGMTVQYTLLELGDGVWPVLASLMKESTHHSGNFKVFVVDTDEPTLQDILPEVRFRHPTLFFGKDGRRAMWLEGTHKENAMYAYNVRYVSPVAMKGEQEAEFERQKEILELLMEHCVDHSPFDSRRVA